MKRRLSALLPVSLLLALLAGTAASQPPSTVDFSLSDVDGKTHRLSDYRGRWVIVNFWASWCAPCVEEIPELADYARANPAHVMLGINFEQLSADEARDFAAETGMDYPVLMIGDTPLPDFEPLYGLPTTAIVTPEGELVANHTGAVSRAMIEDFIRREEALRRAQAAPAKKVP
jgi:thiol-disulfide isomerase/thioredoxin